MQPVYTAKDPHEKAMQRALIQYRDPKNYALVHEALTLCHREDLIGTGPKCLIRPRKGEGGKKKTEAETKRAASASQKPRKESAKPRPIGRAPVPAKKPKPIGRAEPRTPGPKKLRGKK